MCQHVVQLITQNNCKIDSSCKTYQYPLPSSGAEVWRGQLWGRWGGSIPWSPAASGPWENLHLRGDTEAADQSDHKHCSGRRTRMQKWEKQMQRRPCINISATFTSNHQATNLTSSNIVKAGCLADTCSCVLSWHKYISFNNQEIAIARSTSSSVYSAHASTLQSSLVIRLVVYNLQLSPSLHYM